MLRLVLRQSIKRLTSNQISYSSPYICLFFSFASWFEVLLYAVDTNNNYSSQKTSLNFSCSLFFVSLEEGKWKNLLSREIPSLMTWKSQLLTWFLFSLQWIMFWVRKWPFIMWAFLRIIQVWCLEMMTMACPDSPVVGRVSWPGELGPSPLGGITGRQMWCTPPTGFWASVKTSWQVIPITVSVSILKKHFFSFLWVWMIIIVSSPMLDP